MYFCDTVWNNLPVHLFIFSENEIVAGEGDAEDDGGDPLETVDPLLPLGPLAPHVKHPGNNEMVKCKNLSFPVSPVQYD